MKKAMAVFLAAMLLLAGVPGAVAEQAEEAREEGEFGVFDLYDMNGEAAAWLGVAVPLLPGLLITPETNLAENPEGLTISDDSGLWDAEMVVPLEGTHVAFLTFDAETTPPKTKPWPMMSLPGLPDANSISVRSTNAAGDQLLRSVSALTPLTWEGLECMTVTLSGSARPGDPVLTEGNELAGMILAEYSEGVNRYIALSPAGIYGLANRLSERAGELTKELTESLEAPEGFTVTAEANKVRFDWSGMSLQPAEGKALFLVVADAENDYYNFFPVEEGVTELNVLLTPGRTYLSGIREDVGEPEGLPERTAVTALPEAEPLTNHGFTPVKTCLIRSENGGKDPGENPEALDSVTAEDILSGKVCFYSWSRYEVTEREEDTLLVSLRTPEGVDFRYVSGWIYDPDYDEKDIWATPLTDMGWAASLEQRGCPAGEYQVSFYVGGALADSFRFQIK